MAVNLPYRRSRSMLSYSTRRTKLVISPSPSLASTTESQKQPLQVTVHDVVRDMEAERTSLQAQLSRGERVTSAKEKIKKITEKRKQEQNDDVDEDGFPHETWSLPNFSRPGTRMDTCSQSGQSAVTVNLPVSEKGKPAKRCIRSVIH